jgi:hypothetical protein
VAVDGSLVVVSSCPIIITVSPEMIRLSPRHRGGPGRRDIEETSQETSGRRLESAPPPPSSGLLSSGSRLGIFALRAPPEALTKLKLRVEFARYFLFSPSCSTCAQALGAKRLNNVESNLRNGPCARQSIQW